MVLWKKMKKNGFLSNPNTGISSALKCIICKNRSVKEKIEIARKEEVEFNPGIIRHVRNKQQVLTFIHNIVNSKIYCGNLHQVPNRQSGMTALGSKNNLEEVNADGSRSAQIDKPQDCDLDMVAQIDKPQDGDLHMVAQMDKPQDGDLHMVAQIDKPQDGDLHMVAQMDKPQDGDLHLVAQMNKPQDGDLHMVAQIDEPQDGDLDMVAQIDKPQDGDLHMVAQIDKPQDGDLDMVAEMDKPQDGDLHMVAQIDKPQDGDLHMVAQIDKPQNGDLQMVAQMDKPQDDDLHMVSQMDKPQDGDLHMVAQIDKPQDGDLHMVAQIDKPQDGDLHMVDTFSGDGNTAKPSGEEFSNITVKAATVASTWLKLLNEDVTKRLLEIRRSRTRVRRVIKKELPLLILKEFPLNQEKDPNVLEGASSEDLHKARWMALFNQMELTLAEEEKQFNNWLIQVRDLRIHCDGGLQQLKKGSRLNLLDSRSTDTLWSDKELAVKAAAASIFSTSNFLMENKNKTSSSS